MARNGFALALLTALALGGCSTIKGALGKGDKEDKAAQAKLVALRARTDSMRKARHRGRFARAGSFHCVRRFDSDRDDQADCDEASEEEEQEEGCPAGSVRGADCEPGTHRVW